jgi:hypothetical protein
MFIVCENRTYDELIVWIREDRQQNSEKIHAPNSFALTPGWLCSYPIPPQHRGLRIVRVRDNVRV